ncbi:hypothetical protein JTM37_34650, partial [Pseudomonas aeruginosa]|nr:hypothetical protein [Pseudomonas aeruginosa]
DIKIKVQSFGRFLSNMVMPNIGAFIAWGIITALFIPTGWLPNETLAKLVDSKAIDKPYRAVMLNYRNGINKGLYKIMSKMGISTIASYRCSKLFEAVGLHRDVSELCFQGVVSRIGGASFDD